MPSRAELGERIVLFGDGLKGAVVVSDVYVLDPPEGWSTRQVVATVDIDLTAGQLNYSEASFRLVSPLGERTNANTVMLDAGLPGKTLGSGTLTATSKAHGLVTFDAPSSAIDGWLIELPDPSGRTNFVWKLP